MKSVLITGSNRGIGLGLIKELVKLENAPKYIFATCRNPDNAPELHELAKANKNIHVIKFDVKDSKSYDTFVKQVSEKVGEDGLNVLINNAGIISSRATIDDVNEQEIIDVYKVNTVAPIMLTKAFLPVLKKAGKHVKGGEMGVSGAVIVNVSSQVGSIEDNGSGGMYGYRCSKVALNMATKSMSIELEKDGIMAICIHPGWVKTDMGGPNAKITVDESVTAMLKTIMSLKTKDNGTFLRFNGEIIPW